VGSFFVRSPTLDDAEAIAGLANACSAQASETPAVTERSIRAALQTPGLDLDRDVVLATDHGERIVGYVLVQDSPPNAQLPALAEVHPDHRGQGLGTFLCQWIERRACQAMSRLPAASRVTVLQKRRCEDGYFRALLLGQGYAVVRYNFGMVIEMAEPPAQPQIPEAIEVRPFDRDKEGRALVEALREAFRHNWGYVERPFDLEYERWMHILDRDGAGETARYWFVALEGSELAGFALCALRAGQDPGSAGIHVVGVRPAWRRRGIALALLRHSFGALYLLGKRRISLEVDAENRTGATRLYEKAGMRVDTRYAFFEKELRSDNV
jgi:mycothiol synthase